MEDWIMPRCILHKKVAERYDRPFPGRAAQLSLELFHNTYSDIALQSLLVQIKPFVCHRQ